MKLFIILNNHLNYAQLFENYEYKSLSIHTLLHDRQVNVSRGPSIYAALHAPNCVTRALPLILKGVSQSWQDCKTTIASMLNSGINHFIFAMIIFEGKGRGRVLSKNLLTDPMLYSSPILWSFDLILSYWVL